MASPPCKACGGRTEWEADVGSQTCVDCGTLEDASQNVLASHLEDHESNRARGFVNDLGSALKSHRTTGWDLAGQGKEARDRRNAIAMHDYIASIVFRLSHPQVAARSIAIFDLAMNKGKHRWGRKAKLVAGASIAIALREANKADSMRDIAFFLEEPLPVLGRVFTSTVALFNLRLTSADPNLHLPTVQAHVLELLHPPPGSTWPALAAPLRRALTALEPHFVAVHRTATSLCTMLARIGTLANLITAPTASAVYILALEAEARLSLPNLMDFSGALALRFGLSGTTVLHRYRVIYPIVEDWIRDVPWLKAFELYPTKKGERKRSKVGKRHIVAKGLKDVVQFQEEIWDLKVEKLGALRLVLEEEEEQENGFGATGSGAGGSTRPGVKRKSADVPLVPTYPLKKRRQGNKLLDKTSAFLLDPLSEAYSLSASAHGMPAADKDSNADELGLLSHMLLADTSTLTLKVPPSRLTILAASRGGGGEDEVPDDELFEEGELEGFMRTAEEIEVVKQSLDWDSDSDSSDSDSGYEGDVALRVKKEESTSLPATPKKKKRARKGKAKAKVDPKKRKERGPRGAARVNMDALARLLGDPLAVAAIDVNVNVEEKLDGEGIALEWDDWDGGADYKDDDAYSDAEEQSGDEEDAAGAVSKARQQSVVRSTLDDGGSLDEDVDDWRPLSPGGGEEGDWCEF